VSQNNLLQSVGSPGDSTGGTKFVGKNASNGFNQTQMALKIYEQRNRSCQSQLNQNDVIITSQRKGGSLNRNQQTMSKKLNNTH
jgi:regulator of sigma D